MVPFVVVRGSEVTRIPDVQRIVRVVPESRARVSASGFDSPSHSAGKRVIGIQADVLGHVLAIAEVESVIPRTVDRLLIHDAAEHRNSRSGERCRERTCITYDGGITRGIDAQNGDMRVD